MCIGAYVCLCVRFLRMGPAEPEGPTAAVGEVWSCLAPGVSVRPFEFQIRACITALGWGSRWIGFADGCSWLLIVCSFSIFKND